jgi:spermidine synthase
VIPREVIAVADVPGGPPLRLVRHGGDHIIMLERNELMSTRKSGSEKALATMTCERLGRRKAIRLLIGGYGMGFTLRAALAELAGDARVTVAELVPDILDWARGPMESLTDGCLDDPRVEIRVQDVAMAMEPGAYDAILLDVDNGPDGLTREANDRLYSMSGLARARKALRPGGILAVWSAGPDAAFARRLSDAGFIVDEVKLRARENGKGPIHIIWFATLR